MRKAPLSTEQIDVEDVYEAIELYYERGWTDGVGRILSRRACRASTEDSQA